MTINQEIDFEKAEEIAMEYDVLCEKEKKINVIEELLREEEEDEKDMFPDRRSSASWVTLTMVRPLFWTPSARAM